MGKGSWQAAVACALAAVVLATGCPSDQSGSGTDSASARDKGTRQATEAIAAGELKLKEYPPLPSPAYYADYVKLLSERYNVGYEVPTLPAGIDEAAFIQEIRGWNEVMEAEIARKHGPGAVGKLQEEARQRWEERINPAGEP